VAPLEDLASATAGAPSAIAPCRVSEPIRMGWPWPRRPWA